jgi:CheY-like chemotaxis protein
MGEQESSATPDRADRKSRYLLVVDSDPASLRHTSTLLRKFDYQILTAKTAEEALATASLAVPSLIIAPVGLKDRNGIDLMHQLRQDSDTVAVPFIALRKQDDQIGEKYCLEAGAKDCLHHPVLPEVLFRSVEAAVEATPRTNIRIRTLLPVKVNNLPLETPENPCASDLSESGMFLRTEKPSAVTTQLSLQIYLYGQLITVEAVVVYNSHAPRGQWREPGMGVEFTRIEPKDRELLRQFIRSEVTRELTSGNA